tara:strand:- start:333 stop:3035 length:2703 start_codon:yes stop_codon:yes gene_type:complete
MKDLTGTTALTEKDNSWYRIAWLYELDADAPDVGVSTQRSAHRAYTISSNAHADDLVSWEENPISVGWSRIRLGGGLASVAGFTISKVNTGKAMNLTDQYFLENDEGRLYVVFIDGTEVNADRIQIAQGFMENFPFSLKRWDLEHIDGSAKDFREIPAIRMDQIRWPFLPNLNLGKVLPIVFGVMDRGPADGGGGFSFLAPCRNVDPWLRQYVSCIQGDAFGVPYQNYQQQGRQSEVSNYTRCDEDGTTNAAGVYFKIDDNRRKLIIYPNREVSSNDIAAWYNIADNDTSTSQVVGTGDNLDVYFGGMPKAGEIVQADVKIRVTDGTLAYSIDHPSFAGAAITGTAAADPTTISLAAELDIWADDWNFELLFIETAGSGADATATLIWLEILFDDQEAADRGPLRIFQKATGWEDQTAHLNDGAVINNAGDPLENPVDILQAILRGGDLMNRAVAEVNTAAFATALADRSGWKFAFSLFNPVDLNWLNNYCFQAGLHLFKDYAGQWKAVAQEKTRTAQHFFAPHNIAALDDDLNPDLRFSRTPIREVVNEIALKYGLDRTRGEYTKLAVRSGRYRYTGTATLTAAGVLTDGSASFSTGAVPAREGETVYFYGDQEYLIASVDSDTQLTLTAVEFPSITVITSATTYWAGPHLTGAMLRSQLRYKTENPLGGEYSEYAGDGGFASDLIEDDTTAENFLDQTQEWRATRRLKCELATCMNGVDVELGDVAFLSHDWVPGSRSSIQLGLVAEAIDTTETTWDLTTDATWGGAASWRVDDHLLIDKEVVKITAVNPFPTDTIVVSRAQVGTTAASHDTASPIYRLIHKWEVTGIQPDVNRAQFRLELQEGPRDYTHVGICVADGYNDYGSATGAEHQASGWCTLNSGRVVDDDEESDLSHAGAD